MHRLDFADTQYWERCIQARRDTLDLIGMSLEITLEERTSNQGRIAAALRSLDAASDQLSLLSPELCVDYLDAWVGDLIGWERATQRIRSVGGTGDAMDFLGLRRWCAVGESAAARAVA